MSSAVMDKKASPSVVTNTTQTQYWQTALVDMDVRFRKFVRDAMPIMRRVGLTTAQPVSPKDALAYHDVPALAERLKAFLTRKVTTAR